MNVGPDSLAETRSWGPHLSRLYFKGIASGPWDKTVLFQGCKTGKRSGDLHLKGAEKEMYKFSQVMLKCSKILWSSCRQLPPAFCLWKNFNQRIFNQRTEKTQKQRKAGQNNTKKTKQNKKILLLIQSKVKDFSSPCFSRVIDNILSHILWAVLQTLKSPPGRS